MISVKFRRIGENDANGIHKAMHATLKPPYAYSLDMINRFCNSNLGYIGTIDSEVVGYILFIETQCKILKMPCFTICGLGVISEYQRRGIGRRLMEITLLMNKPNRTYLHVRVGNDHALSLYKKLGFIKICDLPGYYIDTDPPSDGIYMVHVPVKNPDVN